MVGKSFFSLREYAKSIAEIERWIEIEPNPKAFYMLSRRYSLQHKNEEAFAAVNRGLDLYPTRLELVLQKIVVGCRLAEISKDESVIDRCFAELEKIIGKVESQKIAGYLYEQVGCACVRMGKERKSTYCIEESIKRDSENLSAHYDVGTILFWEGRYEESIRLHSRCLEINSGYTAAKFGIGCSPLRLGNAEEVVDAFRQCAIGDPANPKYQLTLSTALENSGEMRESREGFLLAEELMRGRHEGA